MAFPMSTIDSSRTTTVAAPAAHWPFSSQAKGAKEWDPILDARELLRKAARLPYEAAKARKWRSRFAEHAAAARSALNAHVRQAEGEDSAVAGLAGEPRLARAVERQIEEHERLLAEAACLAEDARQPAAADIWRVIELGERAIRLEISLARHHNRLASLLHESVNRELGGEG